MSNTLHYAPKSELIMPEYGRNVQQMVQYAMSIDDRAERTRCARTIIDVMGNMFPYLRDVEGFKHKLWDHLYIMSGFKLDIDYPYDVSKAKEISEKPKPLAYPMTKIKVRHYGHLLFESFELLKKMEPGKERDELARLTAEQMKRNLGQWSHGANNYDKVVDDIARFTDGIIQLDPRELQNARFNLPQPQQKSGGGSKGKRRRQNH